MLLTFILAGLAPAGSRRHLRQGAGDQLPVDEVVLVEDGPIPADGEIVAGVASVNKAAITGESAPVIRETAS